MDRTESCHAGVIASQRVNLFTTIHISMSHCQCVGLVGSYGSMARFRSVSRLLRVNDETMIAASGDYADFQFVKELIEQKV